MNFLALQGHLARFISIFRLDAVVPTTHNVPVFFSPTCKHCSKPHQVVLCTEVVGHGKRSCISISVPSVQSFLTAEWIIAVARTQLQHTVGPHKNKHLRCYANTQPPVLSGIDHVRSAQPVSYLILSHWRSCCCTGRIICVQVPQVEAQVLAPVLSHMQANNTS